MSETLPPYPLDHVARTLPNGLMSGLADRYRVERELGTGGMATVYLAEDVRHHRKVALKVLHPELSAVLGPERFLKEIELTANLQHPHILPLFDSGSADGQLFYVMPFVDGETLRTRLEREKQLPIPDALRLAQEVADALQYAHDRGVVHRDIKPENILLQGGHALVADFGIALAVQQAGAQRMTQTGLSLGTPQYMAPEQAMGEKTVDARADIYALGAITWEMLAGEPPFTGPTAQAIVAKVLTADPPPLATLRRNVAPHVAEAVHRALEKLPADRHARAADFAAELGGTATVARATSRAGIARPMPTRRTSFLLAASVIALVASAVAAWALRRPVPERPLGVFTVNLPESTPLTEYTAGRRVAISPDGSRIAFAGGDAHAPQFYVRTLQDTVPRPIRGSTLASDPVFSHDNQWLYFSQQQKVIRLPVDGGAPVVVADSGLVGDVNARNEVLVRRGRAIWLIDASGERRLVTRADSARGEIAHSSARFGEDGKSVLASAVVEGRVATGGSIVHIRLSNGRRTLLGLEGRVVAQTAGHLLIHRDGALWAAPYSDAKLTGPLVQIVDLVSARSAGVDVSVSGEGTLVYVSGSTGTLYRLVAVDLKGTERVLDNEAQRYSWPRVSPDGRRIAVEIGAGGVGFDLWLHDLVDGTLTRLTNNFSGVRPAGWSVDGRRIVYLDVQGGGTPAMRRTIAWIPWDLSGPRELVPVEASAGVEDVSIGRSRDLLAVRLRGYSAPGDIFVAPLDSPRVARPFVATSADEETPRISPDGRWLAYSSDETGRYELYVRPLSTPGGRVQVSAGGGAEPAWAYDGRALFYRGPSHMMRATLVTGPSFAVQSRDTLFADDYRKEVKAVAYDVFPDGRTLLMQKRAGQSSREPTVVFNWLELARRRTGTQR